MHIGDPILTEFIRETIRHRGPMTFAWFMEQALYHPERGYYSSGRCQIGRHGDYFTSVSAGPVFGRLLAAQFGEMWESVGRPDGFQIIEQGAHHGDLARDVLEATRGQDRDFFDALRYTIIEPFPILQRRQLDRLRDFHERLSWKQSLSDLEPFCGVHFSNELLDAMPVHLIGRTVEAPNGGSVPDKTSDSSGWKELCVTESGDGFGFVAEPITNGDLSRHLKTIPGALPAPYQTEINLAGLDWIEAVARKLVRGYVLVIDYGYTRDRYYAPERREGTLQCAMHHGIVRSPFTAIGNVDITAHVDWTSVASRAESNGLSVAGFADQHHFLTGVITQLMAKAFEEAPEAGTRRALQMLLHPEFLGRTFQFLALERSAGAEFSLSGFKFARDPRGALGI